MILPGKDGKDRTRPHHHVQQRRRLLDQRYAASPEWWRFRVTIHRRVEIQITRQFFARLSQTTSRQHQIALQ